MKTIAYLSKYFCIVDASEIQRASKRWENSKTFAGFRKTKKNPHKFMQGRSFSREILIAESRHVD